MSRSRFVLLLLSVLLVPACDSSPVDPADPRADLAVALFGEEAAAAARVPLSLPALVQASIYRVYTEHGAGAARSVVADLQRLQQQARASSAADRETAAARRLALHNEQISVVLRVLGEDVVARVIGSARADAASLTERAAVLEGDGPDRARRLLAEAAELLADAESAVEHGAARAALDSGTRAAARIADARHALSGALRIDGLEELFRAAELRVGRSADGAEELAAHRRLRQAAQEEVRGGDRLRAHEALAAVRAEEIRITLRVLGHGVVAGLLDQTAAAARELEAELARARGDVQRPERMLESARDMMGRARTAWAEGDAALALDLGSHAAGLLNAVRLAVSAR